MYAPRINLQYVMQNEAYAIKDGEAQENTIRYTKSIIPTITNIKHLSREKWKRTACHQLDVYKNCIIAMHVS